MSLTTGRRLRQYQWTPLPMSDEVCDRVEKIALKQQAFRDIVFFA